MQNVFNRDKEQWIRPWNQEKFDDLYNRDERFFAIVVKGLISYLNRNIVLYNKSINHFIFNTGSSYLYMEKNGYEYNLNETTGEDTMYMQLPRCVIQLNDVNIPTEELTSPYSKGVYERRTGNMLAGYNAEIRRLPIELSLDLRYYLSNFNETIILLQELIDKLIFQQYYNITYLGQVIQCSIEFPGNTNPEINKIDMTSPEPNQRNITLNIKICTNYPLINERTETATDKVIGTYGIELNVENSAYTSDVIEKGSIMNNQTDDYNEFIDNINITPEVDTDNMEELVASYDTNNDGLINDIDIENILEKIKYSNYEGLENNIDYDRLCEMINVINNLDNMNIEYDDFTKALYVSYNNSDEIKEIKLNKYKIQK